MEIGREVAISYTISKGVAVDNLLRRRGNVMERIEA
jgi:hypothetical protein